MSRISRDEFNKLTDTGRHEAITAAQERAYQLEMKLEAIWRHLFGAVTAAKEPDEIIARVMKYAEKIDAQKRFYGSLPEEIYENKV